MRKHLLIILALSLSFSGVRAGGILTNTNSSAFFHRMMARGASLDIDGVHTNPAGLAWTLKDGFHLATSYQYVYQKRDMDASFQTYPSGQMDKTYKGRTIAPYVPSVYAVWKQKDWAFSAMFYIPGGGGKAVFDEGVPSFESAALAKIYQTSQRQITSDKVDLSTYMEGGQYVFGLQLGATHRFSEHFSAFVGIRASYYTGNVTGQMTADLSESYSALGQALGLKDKRLFRLAVDCDQTAFGLNPVLGANLKFGDFLIAAKYEFKTKYSLKNKTHENTDPDGALAAYKDGAKSRNDMPAMASLNVGYAFNTWLRAQAGFNYYFDKDCKMAEDHQKLLSHNASEVLLGVEADLSKRLLLSAGVQFTDFGLTDSFQSDTSFYSDSYTVGLGGAYRITDRLRVNAGAFLTIYQRYRDDTENFAGTGLPSFVNYKRNTKSFAITLDYSF